jgi:hypothetical protein
MSEPCPFCHGDGWHSETEHNPGCTDTKCQQPCPVEVQVECRNCAGTGRVGEP